MVCTGAVQPSDGRATLNYEPSQNKQVNSVVDGASTWLSVLVVFAARPHQVKCKICWTMFEEAGSRLRCRNHARNVRNRTQPKPIFPVRTLRETYHFILFADVPIQNLSRKCALMRSPRMS